MDRQNPCFCRPVHLHSSLALICFVLLLLQLTGCGGGASADGPAAAETPTVAPTASLSGEGALVNDEPVSPVQPATPTEPVAPAEPAVVPESPTIPIPDGIAAPDAGLLTRFDAGESLQLLADGQTEDLLGITSLSTTVLDTGARFDGDPGRMVVQYQGGDASERLARIVAEPGNPGNRVLKFALRSANVRDDAGNPVKGRVQLNAYQSSGMRSKEVGFTVRMYLPQDFNLLEALPQSFGWLTISEWWNNAGWTGQDHPFRISVDITKPSAQPGTALRFGVRAQTLNPVTNKWDTTVWHATNTAVEVPVGQWVTLEYYYREGDAAQGRFYLAMVAAGGGRQVLFDQRGWTHHPSDPAPDGLTHLNPLKLYTSKALIDAVRNAGGALQMYWDDIGFRLCRERFEQSVSPCSPEVLR